MNVGHGVGLILLLIAAYLMGVMFPTVGQTVLGAVGLGGS